MSSRVIVLEAGHGMPGMVAQLGVEPAMDRGDQRGIER
jgi:hypothetical protein